jgi:hypothetical protein
MALLHLCALASDSTPACSSFDKPEARKVQAAGATVVSLHPGATNQNEGEMAMSIRTRIAKTAAALTLSAAAAGIVAVSPAGAADGDPSQWDRVSVERKVNEYEGQHRKFGVEKVNEYEGQHR